MANKHVKIISCYYILAATIMPDDVLDNTTFNKDPASNILVTPAIRQMAKSLQVNK